MDTGARKHTGPLLLGLKQIAHEAIRDIWGRDLLSSDASSELPGLTVTLATRLAGRSTQADAQDPHSSRHLPDQLALQGAYSTLEPGRNFEARSPGRDRSESNLARPTEATELRSYLQTNLVQKIARHLRLPELEVADRLHDFLRQHSLGQCSLDPRVTWEVQDRFVNLVPSYPSVDQGEGELGSRPTLSGSSNAAALEEFDMPLVVGLQPASRLFVFTNSGTNPDRANPDRANLDRANPDRANLDRAKANLTITRTQRARLEARVAVQCMAASQLGFGSPAIIFGGPPEFEAMVKESLADPRKDASEVSPTVVLVYPHAIEKSRFSALLRQLHPPALLEALSAAEWGEQMNGRPARRGTFCLIDDPEVILSAEPSQSIALRRLSPGQLLALADSTPRLELDLSGAARSEVQNLLWLARTLHTRLGNLLETRGTQEYGVSPQLPGCQAYSALVAMLADIVGQLSLRNCALEAASRGAVSPYVQFWRGVLSRLLRVMNDPSTQFATRDRKVQRLLMVFNSVLPETARAWEKYLAAVPLEERR